MRGRIAGFLVVCSCALVWVGVAVGAEPAKIPAGQTSTVVLSASKVLARCKPPGEFRPNPTVFTVNPPSVTVTTDGGKGMPTAGSTIQVTVPRGHSPAQPITISWTGNSKCASWNGYLVVKVRTAGPLGGPDAQIGPRKYSPFEQLAKTLILDDYECLKAYSDTCTREEAYLLAAWYVLGGGVLKIAGNVVLKPLWSVIGPEVRALLAKYGPQIAAGSQTALAEFRDQLARLIPQAVNRLPANARLDALDALVPVLKEMPAQVQSQLMKMRAEAILKPGGSYVGSYDAKTGILTVDNPAELVKLYRQLKLGGEAATPAKPYPGQLTTLPGGGTVGLKNKATTPGPSSPNSTGPSIDLNIPGFNIKKIKPATHKS